MTLMIIGLVLFLGMHSVRIFADDWREAQITKRGEKVWFVSYAFISLLGLVLLIYGYGEARIETQVLWTPPIWTKHLAAVFVLLGFVLMIAGDVKGTKIKAKVGHPMILGVKLWAFGHLISNGALVDVILFASFLVWAILDFRASRQRDKTAGTTYEFLGYQRDIIVISLGLVVGIVFVVYLHGMLIGVTPFA